jgi:hypothetical protein
MTTSRSTKEIRLYRELRFALDQTDAADLKNWGKSAAARLPVIATRRVKNFGRLAATVARATGQELAGAFEAWRRGRLGGHLGDRAAVGIDRTAQIVTGTAQAVGAIGRALLDDPKRNVPDVFALALGFYAGSGGLDGNGGIPDTDLALGIGWHRSILTHSIIAGTVVEGAILALADLADVVIDKVPRYQRDPFWDHLAATKDRIAEQLAVGTSAGIAYHLAVDATLQEAPYHDLPFSMPMEGHQAVMGANGVAEGLDAANRAQTIGTRTVDTVKYGGGLFADGMAALGAGLKAFAGKK